MSAFESAKGLKTAQKCVIVRITATDRTTGMSSVEPGAKETAEAVLGILKDRLGPAIIGVDPTNINRLPALDAACPTPIESLIAVVKDTVATTLLDISSGSLALPAGPGFGVDLDDAKIERYRMR